MALKLDELLIKKKEPVQILDLSKSTANSKEELRKLLEKVPEFKIKMEKVRPEDVKIQDKKFLFNASKKELKAKSFPFANPVPSEMKSLRLNDLCSVDIQWRMLTSLRPKNKLDEEYFSKLIELGKLHITTREKESKKPLTTYVRKMKNRVGILETKFVSCRECGEEFCSTETCQIFAYEDYERVSNVSTVAELTAQDSMGTETKQIKRKKKKTNTKKTFNLKKKRSKKKIKKGSVVKSESNPPPVNVKTKSKTLNRKPPASQKSRFKPVIANRIKKTQDKLKMKQKNGNNYGNKVSSFLKTKHITANQTTAQIGKSSKHEKGQKSNKNNGKNKKSTKDEAD